ncbi:hypothetical protein BX600DRAFT_512479 [Xylariales sp. PMI_506]|nr:hypothetical protein BX600DRAFT_512479 [Xylariales sp. PMI_506]
MKRKYPKNADPNYDTKQRKLTPDADEGAGDGLTQSKTPSRFTALTSKRLKVRGDLATMRRVQRRLVKTVDKQRAIIYNLKDNVKTMHEDLEDQKAITRRQEKVTGAQHEKLKELKQIIGDYHKQRDSLEQEISAFEAGLQQHATKIYDQLVVTWEKRRQTMRAKDNEAYARGFYEAADDGVTSGEKEDAKDILAEALMAERKELESLEKSFMELFYFAGVNIKME